MKLLEWEASYSIGIKKLDDQHKGLLELTNECLIAMRENRSSEDIGKIVKRLIKYSKVHFQLEEEYMKKSGYEKLESHKAEHRRFIESVKKFKKDNSTDFDIISGYLMKWLINHILHSDQNYADTLNSEEQYR